MCFIWSASHPNSGGQSAVLVNLAFLSVVHALYMTGVIVGSKTRGKVGNAVAWAGLCVNAVAYFAWLAAVFRESFSSNYAGLILLALVAAYLAVATLAIRRGWADRATVNILLVFALAFLAISPVFGGQSRGRRSPLLRPRPRYARNRKSSASFRGSS